MPSRIEDYALLGDLLAAALVARDGSIDWLCFPRFDSAACFAALLGTPEHGRWQIAPTGAWRPAGRRYREGTLVLETDFEADGGAVRVIDFMPPRGEAPDVIRIVEGLRGQVRLRMELVIRFDYGSIIPWVQRTDQGLSAIAGPDMLRLDTPVKLRGEDFRTVADFDVSEGQRVPFVLTWYRSYRAEPQRVDAETALRETEGFWRDWSDRCSYEGPWREAVLRSLITLKALIYAPTGGIVAAPTTSLPEWIGGIRNWDYRYCWVRDATFSLDALLQAGFHDEAREWREWLLRAAAGEPSKLQIMYGLDGRRRLTEQELPWLPGYEGSRPVRVGNAAHGQFQLDVYGELIDTLYQFRRAGLAPNDASWQFALVLMEFLESQWDQPDEGIWEVRGPRRHFTHSKLMAWVAFDRMVKMVENFGQAGPVERWRAIRDEIREQVCREGYNPEVGAFVQSYGSKELDASLLMMPLVGFLPATDPRMRGTIEAIERHLMSDGFVARYDSRTAVDGLPPNEGMFLACSFWLADNYKLLGRDEDARRLFERLLDLRNDVGLLSEEYDPHAGRLLGNFPQAFSHIALINSAYLLSETVGPPRRHHHP
ncbi:MAG: glycoside hydrolase family 15 protein [Isosphaeraceae bacterium]|nr:glycoside hydrolase family 15 protein [Isosphaeraceae bacterium]